MNADISKTIKDRELGL